jgi:glycosyltransferase involved in cell wall biosynthesis
MIDSYKLKDVITVINHINPPELLSETLIFLSLQQYDNYPSQSVLEAMACGCAVIATDVGNTARIVDSEVGYRVPFDAREIAKQAHALLQDPLEARAKGEQGRKKVMKEYTVEKYAEFVESMYNEASA